MSAARLTLSFVLALTACTSSATGGGMPAPDREIPVASSSTRLRQSTTDERAETSFIASPDRVWTALGKGYTLLGIRWTTNDRESGQYGNIGFEFPHDFNGHPVGYYFRCGSDVMGAVADRGRLVAVVMSAMSSTTPAETRVSTHVSARMNRREGTSGPPIDCASTGKLEQELHATIESLIRQS